MYIYESGSVMLLIFFVGLCMPGRMLEHPEACADLSHIGKQEEKTDRYGAYLLSMLQRHIKILF